MFTRITGSSILYRSLFLRKYFLLLCNQAEFRPNTNSIAMGQASSHLPLNWGGVGGGHQSVVMTLWWG